LKYEAAMKTSEEEMSRLIHSHKRLEESIRQFQLREGNRSLESQTDLLNLRVEDLQSDAIIEDLRSRQILRITEETDSLHKENLGLKKKLDSLKKSPTSFRIMKDASLYHKLLVTQHRTAMKDAYDLKIANIRLKKDVRLMELRSESYDTQMQSLRNRM